MFNLHWLLLQPLRMGWGLGVRQEHECIIKKVALLLSWLLEKSMNNTTSSWSSNSVVIWLLDSCYIALLHGKSTWKLKRGHVLLQRCNLSFKYSCCLVTQGLKLFLKNMVIPDNVFSSTVVGLGKLVWEYHARKHWNVCFLWKQYKYMYISCQVN